MHWNKPWFPPPRAHSLFYNMPCKSFLIPNVCMNDGSNVVYDTQISHDSRLSIFLFIHSFQFLRSMLCKHFRLFIWTCRDLSVPFVVAEKPFLFDLLWMNFRTYALLCEIKYTQWLTRCWIKRQKYHLYNVI
jgi:hypothetical protein